MSWVGPGPRRLVVVAVDEYLTGDQAFTAGIRAQVETITGWLADRKLGDRRRFEVQQAQNLRRPADLRAFMARQALSEAEWDEALVVYVTGHGLRGTSGRHYLTFSGTEPGRLLGTAFPTSELITQVLDSEAEHVLVLIDSCFSGSLKEELSGLLMELSVQRRALRTLAVITSGTFERQPKVGEFTGLLRLALARAADESAGFTGSHLSFEEWEKLLNTVGDDSPGLVEALWVWPDSRRDEPSWCLPNPHHEPREQVVEASRQAVSLTASAAEHWMSRASGRADDDDPGWYFSGRRELMRALVEFVRTGGGVLVVTGAAGSGKSALLARLVTLSDPLFVMRSRFADMARAVPAPLRPDVGAVDAAVLARGRSSLALIDDLLAALGADPVGTALPMQVLLDHIAARSRERPLTVVIDALDEAQEPVACLSDVIAPLARARAADGRGSMRLVLGLRSSAQHAADGRLQDAAADQLLGALHTLVLAGAGDEEDIPLVRLRTDGEDTVEDISAYAQVMLQARKDSPYAGRDEEAARVAAVIARAVTPSFLDARLAAAQLRSAHSPQDVEDPVWRSRLQTGTTALLGSDLRQVAADRAVDVRGLLAVLRATAFAGGSGLPWAEVWPTVASAVLGPAGPPPDEIDTVIRTVCHSRLIGYLTLGEEDGRVTYRPAHQRVAEVLVSEPGSLLADAAAGPRQEWAAAEDRVPLQEVHRAIAEACALLAAESGRLPPHPYVRRHTVDHADIGGNLDDSVMSVALAAWESSGTLRGRLGLPLPVGDERRSVVTSAALVEPYVDRSVDVPSRFSSVSFQLAAQEQAAWGDDASPSVRPAPADGAAPALHTMWAMWLPRANVMASPGGRVHALCSMVTAAGRGLLAASSREGIGVWDATTSRQLVLIRTGVAHHLTVARGTSGRPFLVAAGPRSAAVFDPVSGRRLAGLELSSVRMVAVAQDGTERWTMVVASRDEDLIVWRPSEGTVRQVRLPDGLKLADRLAWVRSADGRGAYLCRLQGGGWALFDPLLEMALPVRLPFSAARSVAAVRGPAGGDLLAVVRDHDEPVVLFDPFEAGEVTARLPVRGRRVVALDGPDGVGAVGVVTDDAVEVWDVSRAAPQLVGRFPAQRSTLLAGIAGWGGAWKLAATAQEGVLLHRRERAGVTASRPDHTSRRNRTSRPDYTPGAARRMVALPAEGQMYRLAVAGESTVDTVAAHTGRVLHSHEHSAPVTFVLRVPGQDDDPALFVGDAAGVQVWHPRRGTRTRVGDAPLAETDSCAVRLPDGEPALVVAGGGAVRVLETDTGRVRELPGPFGGVGALVELPSPRGRCLVAGAARSRLFVWDVAGGELLQEKVLPYRTAASVMCAVPLEEDRPIVAIATAHEIGLWDLEERRPLQRVETSYTTVMTALPQPSRPCLLATGNTTGLRLWDPRTGHLVHSLLTAAPVTDIVHTHDGKYLHIGGPAGLARLSWQPGAYPF